MVAQRRLTALAVGLSGGLLAQHAAGAEALVQKTTPAVELVVVDSRLFRDEIAGYVREHNRQLRETLNADLRRALSPKVVASNELRARS